MNEDNDVQNISIKEDKIIKEFTVEEIKKFLDEKAKNKQYLWMLKKYNPEMLEYINNRTDFLPNIAKISERIYCIFHDIFSPVLCKHCHKNKVKFNYVKHYYYRFCSIRCSQLNSETREKIKQTSLKKYGVDHPFKSKEIIQKIHNTFIENHDYTSVLCLPEIQEKCRKTKLEKYGNEYFIDYEKARKTYLEKYGETHWLKTKDARERIKKTLTEKYGSPFLGKIKEFREKVKQKCQEKYGCNNIGLSKEIRMKARITALSKTYILMCNDDKVEPLFSKEEFLTNRLNDDKPVLKWKCKLCGEEFEQKYNPNIIKDFKTYARCLKCFPKFQQISMFEKLLLDVVKENYTGTIVENDRTVLNPYELDIYLPDAGIGYEADGAYWHSILKGKSRNYHLNKTIKCENQGIHLIHVFESNWLKNPEGVKNTVKSFLINKSIQSSKIKEISYEDANNFFQGFINVNQSKPENKFYGLFDENDLISVVEIEEIDYCFYIKNFVWKHSREECFKLFMSFLDLHFIGDKIFEIDRRFFEEKFLELYEFELIKKTRPKKHKFNNQISLYDCGTMIFRKKA